MQTQFLAILTITILSFPIYAQNKLVPGGYEKHTTVTVENLTKGISEILKENKTNVCLSIGFISLQPFYQPIERLLSFSLSPSQGEDCKIESIKKHEDSSTWTTRCKNNLITEHTISTPTLNPIMVDFKWTKKRNHKSDTIEITETINYRFIGHCTSDMRKF